MALWRVWIGSPRLGIWAWKSYLVKAKDRTEAMREAYAQISGIRKAPSASWVAWNVREVEFISEG